MHTVTLNQERCQQIDIPTQRKPLGSRPKPNAIAIQHTVLLNLGMNYDYLHFALKPQSS